MSLSVKNISRIRSDVRILRKNSKWFWISFSLTQFQYIYAKFLGYSSWAALIKSDDDLFFRRRYQNEIDLDSRLKTIGDLLGLPRFCAFHIAYFSGFFSQSISMKYFVPSIEDIREIRQFDGLSSRVLRFRTFCSSI